MNTAPRDPYLILGIPFGSSASAANKAFARLSRRVRQGRSRYEIADLTWALNQIEHEIENPEESLDYYRLPLDPDVIPEPPSSTPVRGIEPLPRRTQASDSQLAGVRRSAIGTLLLSTLPARPPQWPTPVDAAPGAASHAGIPSMRPATS